MKDITNVSDEEKSKTCICKTKSRYLNTSSCKVTKKYVEGQGLSSWVTE